MDLARHSGKWMRYYEQMGFLNMDLLPYASEGIHSALIWMLTMVQTLLVLNCEYNVAGADWLLQK